MFEFELTLFPTLYFSYSNILEKVNVFISNKQMKYRFFRLLFIIIHHELQFYPIHNLSTTFS